MPDQEFRYRALNAAGKPQRGSVAARDRDAAFDTLRAKGLSPLTLKVAKSGSSSGRLSDRDISAFISDLAALLRAGADVRTALAIVAPKDGRQALALMVRQMATEITSGAAIDDVFARHLPAKQGFIAALVTAADASGDLPGGLERASEMLEGQIEARDRMMSIMAYPMFVLISAVVAFLVILLVVVPSLGPLARSPGAEPGLAMRLLLGASDFLRGHLLLLGAALAAGIAVVVVCGVLGVWAPLFDRFFLKGPLRRLAGSLIYGGFAIALGGILAAGAPIADALRLSIKATRSATARIALQPVLQAVREGQSLSSALGQVSAFPTSIQRLTVIGEQSGSLGRMLLRAGRIEERKALRAVEAAGRVLGPSLIVVLGGLIGLLMAGLLSGISSLGEGAL